MVTKTLMTDSEFFSQMYLRAGVDAAAGDDHTKLDHQEKRSQEATSRKPAKSKAQRAVG